MGYVKLGAVVLAALVVSGLLILLFGKPVDEKKKGGGAPLVTLTTIEPRHFEYRIEGVGTAQANESVTITAKVAERVEKVLFTEGQRVKKGDLLVQLDDEEMAAGLEEMQVELARQQLEYDRVKTLREKNINSQKEVDQQGFTLGASKARVLAYQSKVRDRKIVAPFDGVVGIRLVSPGAFVSPGEKITTIDDMSLIKLKFSVPELYLPDMRVGQEVRATVGAYPGKEFVGRLSIIDTRVDEVTRAVAVQAVYDNKEGLLKPGMLMTVQIVSHPREVLAVPEKCLLPFGKKQYVFIVSPENKATRQEVTIGQRDYGVVEVLSGLQRGTKIILDGISIVKPGDKVRVEQTEAGSGQKPEGNDGGKGTR